MRGQMDILRQVAGALEKRPSRLETGWWGAPLPMNQAPLVLDGPRLRRIAESMDVYRLAVEQLKREVTATGRAIVPRSGRADQAKFGPEIANAEAFFGTWGGHGGSGENALVFEKKLLEDVLVIGAFAVWRQRGDVGVRQQVVVDAATIRPRVTADGWPDAEHPYEQVVQGRVTSQFASGELIYSGLHPRSWTPYFASPIEWLLGPLTALTKADEWNRVWLDGDAPGDDVFTLPPELSLEQIRLWVDLYKQMLSNQAKERNSARFLPGGTQRLGRGARKDQDFEQFQMWLARRIWGLLGVQPASIGFAGEQYKVSQENSSKQTSLYGAGALRQMLKSFYDDTLAAMGWGQLEWQWITENEDVAALRSQRNVAAVGRPYKTINEARKEEGLNPIPGGDELLPGAGSLAAALRTWQRKALQRGKAGKGFACGFESPAVPSDVADRVRRGLESAVSEEDVREVFGSV